MTTPTADLPPAADQTPNIEPNRARRRSGRMRVLAVVAAVVVGIAFAFLAIRAVRPHLYAGTVLQGDAPAPALEGLVRADGSSVDLADYEGDVLMVFFGYANCPDVCPTTMATAAQAMDSLSAEDRDRTRLLMVSVDPSRDTPEYLETFTSFFHPNFSGATGPVEAIDSAASQYGIFYQLGEGEDYTVDHTASLMGIAPDGVLRIVWPPEVTAEQLAGDIAELLG